ncbi:Protein of unknown function DUF3759 [Penicillium italicum]|uniref:Uncharacterized protein n=1 Tax=Penicillium italicum TaxID=40296 RepID=A0A0A2KN92_PENIT|nr:Protein of unknown function DUF3759 [Penicillium italicum]
MEVLGGAAAFEGNVAYQDFVTENGHPISRVKAQQAFAGFIGGFVDRAIETKGFEYLHRDSVKAHAQQRVEPLLDGIYPA